MEASYITIAMERRSKMRYPVALNVRFRTLGRHHRLTGIGQTVNMSSSGLLVAADHPIPLGARLELNVEWPSLLDGLIPLQLVATSRVVRCYDNGFAVSLGQYQFRTMSRRLAASTDWDGLESPLVRSAV